MCVCVGGGGLFVHACVSACVRVCVRACVRACVCVLTSRYMDKDTPLSEDPKSSMSIFNLKSVMLDRTGTHATNGSFNSYRSPAITGLQLANNYRRK